MYEWLDMQILHYPYLKKEYKNIDAFHVRNKTNITSMQNKISMHLHAIPKIKKNFRVIKNWNNQNYAINY